MAESELDKQIKEAQILMYKAKADKAEAEKKKINFEITQEKKVWTSRKFWAQVIVIGGGTIVFLSFFIPYAVIPIAEHKSYVLADSLDNEKKDLKIKTEKLDKEIANNKSLVKNKSDLIKNITTLQRLYDSIHNNVAMIKQNQVLVTQKILYSKKQLAQYKNAVDSLETNSHIDDYFYRRKPINVRCIFNFQGSEVMIARVAGVHCYATTEAHYKKKPYVIEGKIKSAYDINFNLVDEIFYITLKGGEYKIAGGRYKLDFQGTQKIDTVVNVPVEPK